MRTKSILGLLWVSLAMFALPAAAQTPDGMTPAEETICNTDDFANATPGLQGLCVAMCEAQDCEATMEEVVLADGTVETTVKFSPSCNASAKQILANYDKLKDQANNPDDPEMPCVHVACPCWASDEIENIADGSSSCYGFDKYAILSGSAKGGGWEQAFVNEEQKKGLVCNSMEANPLTFDETPHMSTAQYEACHKSIVQECDRRGKPIE